MDRSAKAVPVPWPTNLAWRIRMARYAKAEYFLESRRNKAFAMPFRNWEIIFHKLTLKEPSKIKYMPTEVITVPPNAMVGDMKYIDHAYMFMNRRGADDLERRRSDPMLETYQQTMISYAEFVRDPYIFERPEIMVERDQMEVLPYRVTVIPSGDRKNRQPILALTETKRK